MSAVPGRERITIKDIAKILGYKRAKAEWIYRTMRQAKLRTLPIEQRTTTRLPLFVDDLVAHYPGLTYERCKASMVA